MNIVSPETIKLASEFVPLRILWVGLAEYSEPFFIGLLGVLWLTFFYKRSAPFWNVPAHITLALAISVPMNMVIRLLVKQSRPFVDGSFVPLVPHDPNFGFPSNHAVATMVFTVVVLWFGYRGIGLFLAVLTGFGGISRVVTGLHYPLDIMAGWLLGGGVSALVCYYEVGRFSRILPASIRQKLNTESEAEDDKN